MTIFRDFRPGSAPRRPTPPRAQGGGGASPGGTDPAAGSLEKAYLETESGTHLKCWFNPDRYEIKKNNTWDFKEAPGRGLPSPHFTSGGARKISLELFFDDSDSAEGDVTGVVGTLFGMMEIPEGATGKRPQPPKVKFGWGRVTLFWAVIESMSVRYTLFLPSGLPVRAEVSLSMTQVERATSRGTGGPGGGTGRKGGNPTTRALPGVRTHTLRAADSLQSVAFAAFRDPTRWRVIAEANGIDDPMRLRSGTELIVPPEGM